MKPEKATMAPYPIKHANKLKMTKSGLRWDQVTCLHHYLNELPIRASEKTEQCRINKRTRTRCTVPPTKTPTQEHGLITAETSSHSPRERQAQTLTFTTCQCTIAASSSTTWVPSTESVNLGRLKTCTSRVPQRRSSTSPTTGSCHLSESSGETTTRM